MLSFVKNMPVRIFVDKKIDGKKIRHWQKNLSFFADLFSSYKVLKKDSSTGAFQRILQNF